MLCTRCGKRPAVVFVSNNNSKDAPTAGYCLTCAKELGIKPVEDLISKMGISDEDLENVQDQMNTLMNSMGDGDMSQLMEQLGADNLAEQMGDFSKDGDGSEDDDFSHGAPAFPAFFNSMFGGQNNNATNQDNNKKGKKEKKEKNRKNRQLSSENRRFFLVRERGLGPPRRSPHAPQTCLSTIPTLSHCEKYYTGHWHVCQ